MKNWQAFILAHCNAEVLSNDIIECLKTSYVMLHGVTQYLNDVVIRSNGVYEVYVIDSSGKLFEHYQCDNTRDYLNY